MQDHAKTDCPADAQMEAFVRGDLDADTAKAMEAHVQACAPCRALRTELMEEESLARELRGIPIAAASDATTTHVGNVSVRSGAYSSMDARVTIPGYTIEAELSHGGQGVVYKAWQQSTKRRVALKVLLDGRYASPTARRRFEREVELAANLSHPNIVAVFDSGVAPDGKQYYAMDFVQGIPLTRYVKEQGLDLDKALGIFNKICGAIQYAHQKGVIHRDLKPSNILVDETGEPRILDFGLAKQIDENQHTQLSLTGQVMGTLPYMSPEQSRGMAHEIDTRTDIYALGVILYEMLTGHYPYPVVGQMADVLRHIAETEPTPPTRSWSGEAGVVRRSSIDRKSAKHCPIDDDVQTIVLKLLRKERERRYQSAGEIAADIDRYLSGDPIEAKRSSTWYVLRKLAVRHAYATTITGAMVVSLIGFAGISFYFWQESDAAIKEVHRQDAFAGQQTQQIARLHGVVSTEIAQMAFGWFLLEWHAGRDERARKIQASLPASTPEHLASKFLLAEPPVVDALYSELHKQAPALAFYVLGERLQKNGQTVEAERAFKQSITAADAVGNEWLRATAAARIEDGTTHAAR